MSVRRALDPEAREALRFGVSSGRVPYISAVVPAQIESDDVTYWSWVLALDASTAERLLEGVRLGQAADDQVRERVLLPLFRLAEQVSTPSEQFTVTEAPGLTRALVASRARALAELRSTERAMIERCLTDTQLMPVETETGSQLDALRQQGLTTAQFESLVATRVDVGRFLYRVSKGALRVALSRDSMEIARQCLVDAQHFVDTDTTFVAQSLTGSTRIFFGFNRALRFKEGNLRFAIGQQTKARQFLFAGMVGDSAGGADPAHQTLGDDAD